MVQVIIRARKQPGSGNLSTRLSWPAVSCLLFLRLCCLQGHDLPVQQHNPADSLSKKWVALHRLPGAAVRQKPERGQVRTGGFAILMVMRAAAEDT